jgi:hypothetical protein
MLVNIRNFKFLWCFLIPLISAFISGCEVNPLSQNSVVANSDLNQTLPVISEIPQNIISPVLKSKELEAFIVEQIKLLKNQLSAELEKIDPADSKQIQQIIQKELVTFLKGKQDLKYQFLCDENERWIYRCNRMTGEIECFSMSSNKLRLLSSTR